MSTPYHADAREIGRFVAALFRYAEQDTFISLRAFDQLDRSKPPRFIRGIRVNGSTDAIVREASIAAEDAAQSDEPVVFCPPIATFVGPWKAAVTDLANGLTLSVELDEGDPDAARHRLESILGLVTIIVRSGSDWADAATGEVKPKVHLHWRLSEPTTTQDEHDRLRQARVIATLLAGADPTATPVAHPLRWPGSWNLKRADRPRMATIAVLNEAAEINLGDALEALETAMEAAGTASHADMAGGATGASSTPEARLSDVRSAMAAIPNDPEIYDYKGWVRMGIAVWRATGGAPEGFEIWDNWSRLSDKYGAKDKTEDTWRRIGASMKGPRESTRGAGTIFFLAAAAGWVRPFPFGSNARRPADDGEDDRGDNGEANAPGEKPANDNKSELPPILDAVAFMATFVMPDYLIDGIIQRGRLHALTSPTGHGKTAVALFLACMLAVGRNIGALEVVQGDVLIMGGENPDDLCVRLHAACGAYGIDPALLPVFVMPGNFPLDPEAAETLKQRINDTGRTFSLIIGDSLAAYFPGDDENHNVQMGAYARNWRVLTTCNGRPAVIALAHPIKAATRDNLLPRGGGAFLAEIDANLTLWADGDRETTSLHWQGKIRGADFQPVIFGLSPVTLGDKRDAKGRPLPSVVATLRTAEQAEASIKGAISDENAVLEHLRRSPGISVRNLATACGWVNFAGEPNPGRVQRRLRTLAEMKLVKFWRGKWIITEAGKAELKGEK